MSFRREVFRGRVEEMNDGRRVERLDMTEQKKGNNREMCGLLEKRCPDDRRMSIRRMSIHRMSFCRPFHRMSFRQMGRRKQKGIGAAKVCVTENVLKILLVLMDRMMTISSLY